MSALVAGVRVTTRGGRVVGTIVEDGGGDGMVIVAWDVEDEDGVRVCDDEWFADELTAVAL